jgi:hypothetical protein
MSAVLFWAALVAGQIWWAVRWLSPLPRTTEELARHIQETYVPPGGLRASDITDAPGLPIEARYVPWEEVLGDPKELARMRELHELEAQIAEEVDWFVEVTGRPPTFVRAHPRTIAKLERVSPKPPPYQVAADLRRAGVAGRPATEILYWHGTRQALRSISGSQTLRFVADSSVPVGSWRVLDEEAERRMAS